MMSEVAHGGDVDRVAAAYGLKPEEILDHSSNINPLPLPEQLGEVILANLNILRRYPDRNYLKLRQALSAYTGCPADQIMVGNGATELIYLAARAFQPRRALLPAPSFADYQCSLEAVGCSIDLFRLREEDNFRLNLDKYLKELARGYGMTILCNPNNPTGQILTRPELHIILEEAHRHDTLVFLDECFAEFVPDPENITMLNDLSRYNNLIILRALTKFFAVPGLRLGYCLAGPQLLARMQTFKEPWTVNSLAGELGSYLLTSEDFINRTRSWIAKERPYLVGELQKIPGIKAYETAANFVLIRITKKDWNVKRLKAELESRGIMIRDASTFSFLDESYARLAIKDRHSNDRLLETLNQVLQESPIGRKGSSV